MSSQGCFLCLCGSMHARSTGHKYRTGIAFVWHKWVPAWVLHVSMSVIASLLCSSLTEYRIGTAKLLCSHTTMWSINAVALIFLLWWRIHHIFYTGSCLVFTPVSNPLSLYCNHFDQGSAQEFSVSQLLGSNHVLLNN